MTEVPCTPVMFSVMQNNMLFLLVTLFFCTPCYVSPITTSMLSEAPCTPSGCRWPCRSRSSRLGSSQRLYIYICIYVYNYMYTGTY